MLSGHAGALADLLSIDKDAAAAAARSAKTLMHSLQHAATNAATGLSHLLPSPRGGGRNATPRGGGALLSTINPLGQLPGMTSANERARVDPKEGQAHCGSSLPPPSGMGELWGRAFGHAKEESKRRASSMAGLLSRRSSSQSVGAGGGGDSARQGSADELPTGGGGAAVRPAEEGGEGAQPDSEPPTSEGMGEAATPGVDGSGVALEVRGAPGLDGEADGEAERPGPALMFV